MATTVTGDDDDDDARDRHHHHALPPRHGVRHQHHQTTRLYRDEGIDSIINEDRLGLDVIYIQAKRWETCAGRPEVQKFAGALQGQRAKKGIVITTSFFSADARDYVGKIDNKIALIDGRKLAELMIDHDLGVSPMASHNVKRIDADYFTE